ncbi:hypothetical protein [Alkalihalobacillus deserti]|uniref:hypothetical protein n=1 Tax=Alkalihalobacillus deserti TaxID=2879466 RepID=UPI001D15C4E4|nr:hypothetical protein [Alkalihalobacillus deserti]
MPDWSYHSIFKPVLFRMPPKKARDFTFGALKFLSKMPFGAPVISFFGHMEQPEEIKKEMLGIEFVSPVGMNGRLDPNLQALQAMAKFGFGFLTVGPVTLKPVKEGEVKRDIGKQEIGYEQFHANSGLEETYKYLSDFNKHGCKLMVRVSLQGDIHKLHVIMDRLLAIADLFIIEGIEEAETFRYLKERYSSVPILLGVQAECSALKKHIGMEPDGIVVDDARVDPETSGYWIGRESKASSLEMIRKVRKKNRLIPIIASGGVTEPQDALDLLDAGADLIQIHQGLVFSGPSLPKRINEALAARSRTSITAPFKEWGWLFLMGLGVFLAGMIAMIFALSSVILPYDETYLGLTKEQLEEYNSKLFSFISHDRNTLAGVMISAGFLYMQLAYHAFVKKHIGRGKPSSLQQYLVS